MSMEAAKEFLAKIAGDQALAQKVKEAGADADEIIRLGREQGFEFTAEDLKAVSAEMEKLVGDGLQRFLGMVSTDEDLARKLEEAGTDLDAVIRLGKENGCEFTEENLTALQGLDIKSDEELSDEDLENVAGGVFGVVVIGLAMAGALAMSAMAGAVAGGVGYAVGHATGKGGK